MATTSEFITLAECFHLSASLLVVLVFIHTAGPLVAICAKAAGVVALRVGMHHSQKPLHILPPTAHVHAEEYRQEDGEQHRKRHQVHPLVEGGQLEPEVAAVVQATLQLLFLSSGRRRRRPDLHRPARRVHEQVSLRVLRWGVVFRLQSGGGSDGGGGGGGSGSISLVLLPQLIGRRGWEAALSCAAPPVVDV